jgi:hypothetical protein
MKTERLQTELEMLQRKMQLEKAAYEEDSTSNRRTNAREVAAVTAQHEHDMSLLKERLEEAGTCVCVCVCVYVRAPGPSLSPSLPRSFLPLTH